jgi:hypothetical protein
MIPPTNRSPPVFIAVAIDLRRLLLLIFQRSFSAVEEERNPPRNLNVGHGALVGFILGLGTGGRPLRASIRHRMTLRRWLISDGVMAGLSIGMHNSGDRAHDAVAVNQDDCFLVFDSHGDRVRRTIHRLLEVNPMPRSSVSGFAYPLRRQLALQRPRQIILPFFRPRRRLHKFNCDLPFRIRGGNPARGCRGLRR